MSRLFAVALRNADLPRAEDTWVRFVEAETEEEAERVAQQENEDDEVLYVIKVPEVTA